MHTSKLAGRLVVAIIFLAVGCIETLWADVSAADNISVVAAASTVDALEEARAAYLKQHPRAEIELSFAASSTAAKQIVAGSPADLFISASDGWADFLEKKELVTRRTNLLRNRLVVVVAKDSPLKLASPSDLLSTEIRKLALAEPESVPAGIYARQALQKLRLWDAVREKYVGGANVRQAMQFVESGAAEAAIVYQTDAMASKKLKIALQIDAKLSDPIRYPLVLLKKAEKKSLAAEFYDYLQSRDAAQIFRRHGFLVGDDLNSATDSPNNPRPQP